VISEKSNEINGTYAEVCHGSTTNPEARSQKPEERERVFSVPETLLPQAEATWQDTLVRPNCTAIAVPSLGISIPYISIEQSAQSHGLPSDVTRSLSAVILETWAQRGHCPDNPEAQLHAALGAHAAAQRARDGNAKSQPAPAIEPTSPAAAVLPKKKKKDEYSEQFELWWKLYPRKEGKGAASKAFEKLTLNQKRQAWKALRLTSDDLASKMNDTRGNFCPQPATWLNQNRFDDTPCGTGGPAGNPILLKKPNEAQWDWQDRIAWEIEQGKVSRTDAEQAGWSPIE
jgi:hypothetical protein